MSASLTLSLTRTRALLIGVCFLAAGLLLFVAGTASGLLLASANGIPPVEKDAPLKAPALPKLPAAQPDAASGNSASASAAPADPPSAAMPALVAVLPPPPPAPPQAAAATTAANAKPTADKPTASTEAASADDASDAIPLGIRVCSFTSETSAQALIDDLALKGFHASMIQSTKTHGHPWYIVKLGPYTEWNTASTVASRIAIAENVHPVVGPMRY